MTDELHEEQQAEAEAATETGTDEMDEGPAAEAADSTEADDSTEAAESAETDLDESSESDQGRTRRATSRTSSELDRTEQAAVERDHRSREIGGPLRAQERHQVAVLVGSAEPLGRDSLPGALLRPLQ
jgi:hypothetical protein